MAAVLLAEVEARSAVAARGVAEAIVPTSASILWGVGYVFGSLMFLNAGKIPASIQADAGTYTALIIGAILLAMLVPFVIWRIRLRRDARALARTGILGIGTPVRQGRTNMVRIEIEHEGKKGWTREMLLPAFVTNVTVLFLPGYAWVMYSLPTGRMFPMKLTRFVPRTK